MVTVKTYQMSQLAWTMSYVHLPEMRFPIAAHHLSTISESDVKSQRAGARSVLLVYGRSKEPVCRIIIDESSEKDFQSLQNALFTGKLRWS